jgi:FdhD protein
MKESRGARTKGVVRALEKDRTIVPVVKYADGRGSREEDTVSIEEPLEIFIDGSPYYLTMRLPGEEMQLALGLCYTEGIIDSFRDVLNVNYCGEETGNRIDILLDPGRKAAKEALPKARRFASYSSCGVCGKDMIDALNARCEKRGSSIDLNNSDIKSLHEILEKRQHVFNVTGGTHGAAIFKADRTVLSFSEDVGRHNALDKAIGSLLFAGTTREAAIVVVTSRLSYEMVQKTGRLASAEILIGVSSATSLAIELAESIGLTLVGFSRKDRGNIYTRFERIVSTF